MLVIALQFSVIQTFISKQVAQYLSKELNADITLDRVYFKPFNSLELVNFIYRDRNGKTILAVKKLESSFSLSEILAKKIEINNLLLDNAFVNFEIYKDSTNFSNLISYFSSSKKIKNKKSSKIDIKLKRIEFSNNEFHVTNHTSKHHNKGVDFSNLRIKRLSGLFDEIKIDSTITSTISNLTFEEQSSGLILRKLKTKATYSANYMEFSNLYLATNKSVVQDYLKLEYKSIKDFSDFIYKVTFEGNLSNSRIYSSDIEFFAPDLKTVIFDAAIQKAKVRGTLSNIIARDVSLKTGKESQIEGDLTIKGLPNINSTVFNFNLKSLKTSAKDLEYIIPKLTDQNPFKLPKQLFTLGNIDYKGSFVGLYNDFTVDGKLKTEIGEIKTTNKITLKNSITYVGNIQSNDFNIGKLIENKIFTNTNFNIQVEGKGLDIDDLELTLEGDLQNSHIYSYTYDKLNIKALIKNKVLETAGSVLDENLNIDFNSTVDWKNENPNYLLDAKVNYASLNNLKWFDKDSIIIHSARINTNLIGHSLNTFAGHLLADSINMNTTKGVFQINKIDFIAKGNEKERSLQLESDFLDANITGNIELNTIIPYFKSLAMRYAPASAIELTPYNSQNFNLELKLKSFKPIAVFIDENLSFDDGAYLNAAFSSDNYTAKFVAFSPTVNYKGIKITNLAIQETADEKAFSLDITADRLNFTDSTYINKIAISNVLVNDSLRFNVELSNKAASNYLNLNGNVSFEYNSPALIKFQPSSIIINKESWSLNNNALLRISKGKIYINNLLLGQGKQQIKLNGIVSNEDDKLNIIFSDFNLRSLNGITKPLGINLLGDMNGNISLNSVLRNPFASANLKTSPIEYNGLSIGKLDLNAEFDPLKNIANLDIQLLDENKRGILLNGSYDFSKKNSPLNLSGKLQETDLTIFQPFLNNLISNLKGRSNADLTILGSLNNPKISGIGRFNNTEFTVNYLKTLYKVNNQIAIAENNNIILQNFTLNDSKGQQAKANGIINLSKLANPYIDVDVNANNFKILNTNFKDNILYYGTAYASGNFKFKGYTSAINIDIDAKSESGTVITIPFNSAMTISDNDFIYFVSKDSTENKNLTKNSFNGLTMNMDLNLTRNAEVNLQTNLGSVKGNGNGIISMKISSLGDFEMFGNYVVNNGKFHFTAQDFFNKYFDIKEGGTIRWTGNPSEAIINLNAIYQQRTSTKALYNAAGRDAGQDERVLAQADMLIKGTLEQPDISFDLNFPQNPYIKDQLQSYLSDANNVNQQALSLIVRRSFTPSSTDQIGREVNNTLLSAGAEIAFNQLNNIISQSLNINFFDLNIRSFNDASASVRLWDDRLILTGGITDRTNFQATDLSFFRQGVTTDAELSFRLRKDGSLTLRAYNRPYTRNFLLRSNDAEYISALGVVYRQEFNNINEFWRRMWSWGGIKKEEKTKDNK